MSIRVHPWFFKRDRTRDQDELSRHPRWPRFHHMPPVAFRYDLPTLLRALIESERENARAMTATTPYAFDSGRSALRFALERLAEQTPERRQVVVPAYTCYSVAAAVEYAGLELVPCDLDPATLDLDAVRLAEAVGPSTLCIIAAHLCGWGVDLDRAARLARRAGCHLIEDAAQAAEPFAPDTRATLRLVSTARGKPLSTGGGGFLSLHDTALRERFDAAYERLARPPRWAEGIAAARLAAMGMFSHPRLFWAPAAVPALHLGETIYPASIEPGRLGSFARRLAARLQTPFARERAARRDHASAYAGFLREHASGPQPSAIEMDAVEMNSFAPHRFPVYLTRDFAALAPGLRRAAWRAGVAPMYPRALTDLPRVRRSRPNPNAPTPGADWIARRLVTLPTHARVDAAARRRALDRLVEMGV